MSEILKVEDLNVSFRNKGKGFFDRAIQKQVLFDVSLSVNEGEIVGLVGESGSGKSTIAKAVLGLVPCTGTVTLSDGANPRMIFQDPAGSLDPSKKLSFLLEEALLLAGEKDRETRRKKAAEKLEMVGLSREFLGRYPRELSGGQRQRAAIALALMQEPGFLIADEPVSALDVTIQAQVLELLNDLQEKMGLSILFISHDLRVVYHMCDRVVILRQGRVVEEGIPEEVYRNPQSEYTRLLLSSIS
ncbi:MAG: ATP-binding cassette domain-containing protein [Lachnospiraceae bacterium]|nr:ATP-binding cassette domain-containing protein [Lachnospiraceae bacterium]